MRSVVVLGFRRIIAFTIDWCVVAVYAGLLFLFVSPVAAPLFKTSPRVAEAAGFCLLTLPMVLYFTLTEASPWRATLGKRIMRLRVAKTQSGRRMSYKQSFVRTALKFLPWELAHFAVWNVFVFTDSPAGGVGIVALTLSYVLIFTYGISLFVASGRTPYDRIAQTIVRR